MHLIQLLRSRIYYLLGMIYYHKKKWHAAEIFFACSAGATPNFASSLFKLGMCRFRQNNWQGALDVIETAVGLAPSKQKWILQRDQSQRHLGYAVPSTSKLEEELLRSRISDGNSGVANYDRLAKILRKQGRRWLEIKTLETALALDASRPNLYFRLGDALEAMRQYQNAGDAFCEAARMAPNNADYAFRMGFAYSREGLDGPANQTQAAEAYVLAIKADNSNEASKFGVGVFHQKRGYWGEAVAAYNQKLLYDPCNAELLYRLGVSCDRCYDWEQAESFITRSLASDNTHAYRHARLGFVFERQNKFLQAAAAYEYAAEFGGKDVAERRYRQGVVLAQAGTFIEAAQAFLKMEKAPLSLKESIKNSCLTPYLVNIALQAPIHIEAQLGEDFRSPQLHFTLAQAYERLGDWSAAINSYRNAIARQDEHTPTWYFYLGAVLAKARRFEESCKVFVETRALTTADGGLSRDRVKDTGALQRARYAEYYERLPIVEKTVLYESFHGRSMSCNPRAIFCHLLTRKDFADWTHIWVVNDRDMIPQEFRSLKNVVFLTRRSDAYMRALASAKVLVNNSTFHYEFIRKESQIYLNTWHGTPIKTLGKFIGNSFKDHANTARNFLQATHLISPNTHTSAVLRDDYDIGAVFQGAIAETGYPRIDVTLACPEVEGELLRKLLGAKMGEKILLYAPTYRGVFGNAKMNESQLIGDLKAMQCDGYHIVFRGHYETEKLFKNNSLLISVVPKNIDTNVLLAVTDLLISDYSSIAIDFLPRRKPIVYYAYDIADYELERGMYFPLSDLPGEIVQERDELGEAIREAEVRFDALHHEEVIARFCPMEDGTATSRVVDWVFHDNAEGVRLLPQDNRTKLLFYAGSFLPNGITNSFINLTSKIDYNQYAVTVIVDADLSNHEDRVSQFARLPQGPQVIGRIGVRLFTHEENWIESKLASHHNLSSSEMWRTLKSGYEREFRRLLGPVQVEAMINFDGYTRFYHSMFAFAPKIATKRKVIYLHNDMREECRAKFPYLEASFRLYDNYDTLVSVSKSIGAINADNLAHSCGISKMKFTYAPNLHNPEYIQASANASLVPPEDESLFEGTAPVFLTMGRLSIEKGHEKLIRAFAAVVALVPKARLLILGDGPLRHDLGMLIKSLGLGGEVFLLGQKENPFPYLVRADCFVFPSNHEGQGMVLHEALLLGKPVIASDIPTSREILADTPECLVENTSDGFEAGMFAFMESPPTKLRFDIDAYQEEALVSFHTNVLSETCRPIPNGTVTHDF